MKPAEKGFSVIVQYLLENNADPNIADEVRLMLVRVTTISISRMSELSGHSMDTESCIWNRVCMKCRCI